MSQERSELPADAGPPRPQRGAEVQRVLHQERLGVPFLMYRGGEGGLKLAALPVAASRITLGREERCDVTLSWDQHLSRSHAEFVRVGSHWTIVDDGLSRNGTFVNGERVAGRRRLEENDVILAGSTTILYRNPGAPPGSTTRIGAAAVTTELTPMQRKVLVELARPLAFDPYAAPASNPQIARALVLSTEAVKSHMRSLFDRFAVGDLPQNQKRARVVQLAFQQGLVSERELAGARE